MTYSGPTREPEDGGPSSRRGLFARREPSLAEPMMTPAEHRLAQTLARAVEDRLDDGLQTIEEQATAIVREVAAEVWRASAQDVRPEQERIVSLLSRDQAIRSLIASSDERFQSLAVRTARLEDHLDEIANAGRETRTAMEASVDAIREIAQSPTLNSVEAVRSQLELVERHIAEAFAHMDERDQLLSDTVLQQVRDHGELIANETSRVVESMQGYVQLGTEAMGHLAERIERHADAFVAQDLQLEGTIRGALEDQTNDLTQQLDLVREKVGMHGRDQEALRTRIEALLESRVRGLAELVRSDSLALRGLVEERLAGAELAEVGIDQHALIRSFDERMVAMEHIVEERLASFERALGDQVLGLSTAMAASVERNLGQMSSAAGSVDGLDEMIAETQAAFEERISQRLDDRMAAIGRLIRSDNQVLLGKLAEAETPDADVMRQLVRSVKELGAGTSSDVMSALDHRFQTLTDQMHRDSQLQAEAILKVAEVMGQKMDALQRRVDEGMGSDVQIVVDRMSDAIQAMSSARRRDIA